MARQDIANMLTGMGGGSTRPNPNMSSSDWRMAFGAQQAQGLMNAAGTTTPQEAIQMGIGNLDLGTVKGLQTLGQMQQIRGDTEAAAKTASQIEAMKQKEEDEKLRLKVKTASKANRASIANQLNSVTYSALREAVINEEGTGRTDALKQALAIIGQKGVAEITDEQKTYNAVVASNKAAGLESPIFTNWRKGEIAEKNMSPKRREYAEIKQAAVKAGKNDFPSYDAWHNKQGLDTLIDKRIDTATGIETSYLINKKSGEIVKELGVTAMPTLSVEQNNDGTYSVYNATTGVMGDPVNTKEAAAIKQKKFYATMSAINAIDGTLGALSEAQRLKGSGPDGESVGGYEYALLSFIPETDARLLKSKITSIQANLAFDKLQNMRDNSPTGGALGQVSNLELDLLKAAIEALDPKLGVEAFNGQVVRIAEHYNRFKQSLLEQSDYVVDSDTGAIFITSPEGKIYRVGTQATEVL